MKRKMTLRTAGLLALCLLLGGVLPGALGGAQVGIPIPPPPPEPDILLPGDPGFEALIAATPKNRLPGVSVPAHFKIETLEAVRECGTTIALIAIDPEAREIQDPLAAARSLDDGPIFIGAARSYDDGSYLLDKVPLPRGEYRFWMEEIGRLGIKPPPEMDGIRWYIIMTTISPDGKIDIRAFLFYRDEVFRTPEQWLRIIGSLIHLKEPCPEPEPEPIPPPPPEPPVT